MFIISMISFMLLYSCCSLLNAVLSLMWYMHCLQFYMFTVVFLELTSGVASINKYICWRLYILVYKFLWLCVLLSSVWISSLSHSVLFIYFRVITILKCIKFNKKICLDKLSTNFHDVREVVMNPMCLESRFLFCVS